jgi:hypothetical protein
MSEAKFTKGEWNVQFGDMIFASDEINNEQVAVVCNEENKDKHLIAAAPEMYEMLVQLHIVGGLGIERHRKIDRLLSKARGESC